MDHPFTQCHNVLCQNPHSLDRQDLLQHEANATLYSTHNTSRFQGGSSKKMTQVYEQQQQQKFGGKTVVTTV
jgi:hypothetical protein